MGKLTPEQRTLLAEVTEVVFATASRRILLSHLVEVLRERAGITISAGSLRSILDGLGLFECDGSCSAEAAESDVQARCPPSPRWGYLPGDWALLSPARAKQWIVLGTHAATAPPPTPTPLAPHQPPQAEQQPVPAPQPAGKRKLKPDERAVLAAAVQAVLAAPSRQLPATDLARELRLSGVACEPVTLLSTLLELGPFELCGGSTCGVAPSPITVQARPVHGGRWQFLPNGWSQLPPDSARQWILHGMKPCTLHAAPMAAAEPAPLVPAPAAAHQQPLTSLPPGDGQPGTPSSAAEPPALQLSAVSLESLRELDTEQVPQHGQHGQQPRATAGAPPSPAGSSRGEPQPRSELWLSIGSDLRARCTPAPEEQQQGQQGALTSPDDGLADVLGLLPEGLRSAVEQRVADASNIGGSASGTSPCTSAPFTTAPGPPLVEVAVDEGRCVRLVLLDGTKIDLEGCTVPVEQALGAITAYLDGRPKAGPSQGRAPEAPPSCAAQGPEEPWWAMEDGQSSVGSGVTAGSAFGSPTGSDRQGWTRCNEGNPKALFGSDNRCSLPGSLHRISALRDPRDGSVYGLTYRVGRHVPGVASLLADVLTDLAGRGRAVAAVAAGTAAVVEGGSVPDMAGSLLLLGRPGSGKTTLLRDIARFLADELRLSVLVVDTSNEIAGGDTCPHACIGRARRLMVGQRRDLAERMIEAVQNHGPEVVVVDELGTKQEVAAARTISQRGVMLVATAHGTDLAALLHNPELNPLVGGLQSLILGDEAARRGNRGSKMRVERRGLPTFRTLVEVLGGGRYRLRPNVARSVDALLGGAPSVQLVLDHTAGGAAGGGQGRAGGESQEPGCLLVRGEQEGSTGLMGGSGAGRWVALPYCEQVRWREQGSGRMCVQVLGPGGVAG